MRAHDDLGPRQALADIVVAFAGQLQRHAPGTPGAEALPGDTGELHRDGVFRQARMAVALGHLAGEHGARRAVIVVDLRLDHDLLALLLRHGSPPAFDRRMLRAPRAQPSSIPGRRARTSAERAAHGGSGLHPAFCRRSCSPLRAARAGDRDQTRR